MGLQKYRADTAQLQTDGATLWYANWMAGLSLAKIANCRIAGHETRRMVYITGEPDTYFSQPAACTVRGHIVRGYVTSDDNGMLFHAMDAYKHFLD